MSLQISKHCANKYSYDKNAIACGKKYIGFLIDGVAHEDAGLQPHPVEGGGGGILRLQAPPKGV